MWQERHWIHTRGLHAPSLLPSLPHTRAGRRDKHQAFIRVPVSPLCNQHKNYKSKTQFPFSSIFFTNTIHHRCQGDSKRCGGYCEWRIGNGASLGLFNNAIFLLYVICLPIHWVDRSAGRAGLWRNMRGDHHFQSIHANSGTQTWAPDAEKYGQFLTSRPRCPNRLEVDQSRTSW